MHILEQNEKHRERSGKVCNKDKKIYSKAEPAEREATTAKLKCFAQTATCLIPALLRKSTSPSLF